MAQGYGKVVRRGMKSRDSSIPSTGGRAIRAHHDTHVRAFYEQLLAAGKKPMQALVAVMRKLLHAIYGMLKTNTDWDGSKFRRLETAAKAA